MVRSRLCLPCPGARRRTPRPGIFHDGQPITADDIVWNYKRLLAEMKSPVRTYISKLTSVEVSAPNTVRFVLSEPFAPFDRQVSLISIVSKRAFEEIGAA